jgi:hypothetical protein
MAKVSFKNTIKALKNQNNVFIVSNDDFIYLSNGHFIIKVHRYIYNNFFCGKAVCFPIIPDGVNYMTAGTGRTPDIRILDDSKIGVMYEDEIKNNHITAKVSPLILDLEKGNARSIFYKENGEIKGIVINELYYQVLLEIVGTCKEVQATKPNAPISVQYKDEGIVILPINYSSCNDFIELLLSMNAEANYRKELRKIKGA